VRTGILDAAVRSFADGNRRSTVITVGAALCTRCMLLPPAPNRTVLGESALGSEWRARVAAIEQETGTRTVDVHVHRLRRKLGAKYGRCLVTMRHAGYKFSPQAAQPGRG
jgi:hypothetical protein